MASRSKIQFDFNQAKKQAGKIDDIADNLSGLSQKKLESAMQTLSVNWKGANASAYLAKGGRLQTEINKTALELHSIASDIRTIAQRVYDAEMEAVRIAGRTIEPNNPGG